MSPRNLAAFARYACKKFRASPSVKNCGKKIAYAAPPFVNYFTDYFKTEEEQNDFEHVLIRACSELELKLEQYMDVLRISVSSLSCQYRQNIVRQIELMQGSGDMWTAEIETLQEKNERLRQNLYKYKTLATTIGNMAYDQAISSLHLGSEDPKRIVCKVYCGFESFVKSEFSKNDEYVKRLEQMKQINETKVGEGSTSNMPTSEELRPILEGNGPSFVETCQ